VLWSSAIFIVSFSTIFVVLGVTASGIGMTLRDHRETLERVGLMRRGRRTSSTAA